MDESHTAPSTTEKNVALIPALVRAFGAVVMLLGTAIGVNLGGLADMLSLADGLTERIAGGGLFIIGLIDFLIMPQILSAKLTRR